VDETTFLLVESSVAFAFTLVFGSFYLWLTSDVVRDLLVEKRLRGSRLASWLLRHAYKGQGSEVVLPDRFVVK
jgi:hypothetical protein